MEWLRVNEKEISTTGHPKIGGDLPLYLVVSRQKLLFDTLHGYYLLTDMKIKERDMLKMGVVGGRGTHMVGNAKSMHLLD